MEQNSVDDKRKDPYPTLSRLLRRWYEPARKKGENNDLAEKTLSNMLSI